MRKCLKHKAASDKSSVEGQRSEVTRWWTRYRRPCLSASRAQRLAKAHGKRFGNICCFMLALTPNGSLTKDDSLIPCWCGATCWTRHCLQKQKASLCRRLTNGPMEEVCVITGSSVRSTRGVQGPNGKTETTWWRKPAKDERPNTLKDRKCDTNSKKLKNRNVYSNVTALEPICQIINKCADNQ